MEPVQWKLDFNQDWLTSLNVSILIFLGPPNLPLVGSYPFFYKKNSLSFSVRNLVKNYGPVSGFFIGSQKVVVIADFEIMKSKLALNQVLATNKS